MFGKFGKFGEEVVWTGCCMAYGMLRRLESHQCFFFPSITTLELFERFSIL